MVDIAKILSERGISSSNTLITINENSVDVFSPPKSECEKAISKKQRYELLWFVALYFVIISAIAIASALSFTSSKTDEQAWTMLIFFIVVSLFIMTYGGTYFCVKFFEL